MTARSLTFTVFALSILFSNAQLLINEVDSDQTGSDSREFIELYDGGAGGTSLDGYVIVIYNGGNSRSLASFDLDGLSTDAFGFFVAGQSGVPGVNDRVVAGTGLEIPGGKLQNGEEAVALYLGNGADFPDGSATTTAGLVDAVVYASRGSFGPDDSTTLITELGITGTVVDEGLGTNMDAGTASVGRSPNGSGALLDLTNWTPLDLPTYGVNNVPSEEISVSIDNSSFSENGGSATLTVTLDSAAVGDVDILVEFAGFDTSEVSVSPSDPFVPGGMASVDLTLTGIDDAWRDFDQSVLIKVSDAFNQYIPGGLTVTVTDDETGSPVGTGLRINEVYPAVGGDANGDGSTGSSNGSDEFVELVNDSASALDISNYTLWDSFQLVHTFPAGTVLDPGCALVVFGADAPEGQTAQFGGATIQNANAGTSFPLELNNSGDIVSIKNTGGVEVAGATWIDAVPANGSFTLDPDLNASNTFTIHANFGIPFSPGVTTSGDPFCISDELTLSVTPATIAEDAGPGAATLTITRTGSLATGLNVMLSSDDTSEATVQETALFAIGVDEIDIPIDIENDTAQDGTQTVTFTASSAGFIDGTTTLDVTDDGDLPTGATITINEVDYNPDGTDDEGLEFVELYDGGEGNTPLDGFVLVFYNGNDNNTPDGEYRIVDLAGAQTDASGFYVISTPSNGIQNGGSGGDGMALFSGAAATAFDGLSASERPAGAVLVDSLVYEIGDGVLATGLGYAGPDLEDSGSGDEGISRIPDGTGAFQLAPLTRGSSNGGGGGNAYNNWAAGFPGIGGREEDDDFDGLSTILEFALGFDPTVPNSLPDPTYDPATGNLRLTVPKGPEAAGDANTTYFASTSIDGATWSNNDLTIVTDDANTFAAEYTGNAPTALLRIGVNLTP